VAVLVTAVSERVASLGRSLVLLFIPSSSATRTVIINRQTSLNIAFFASAIKGGVFSFNPSLSFVVYVSPERVLSLSRTSGLNIVAYLAGARSQGLSRQVSQSFYAAFQAFKSVAFARDIGQSLMVSMSVSRGQTVARQASQTLSEQFQTLRATLLARSIGQEIAVLASVSRSNSLARAFSQSLSESFQTLRTVAFARNVNLNIMFSLSGLRSQSLAREAIQTLSESFQVLRTASFVRGVDLSVQSIFSVNTITSGIHNFFVNVALSLGITVSPQRQTVMGRASSMLFAPSFMPTVVTGPYVIGGQVVGGTLQTPAYRVTVTYFSVGSNLVQNSLTVDSNVKVESISGERGFVFLMFKLVSSNGTVFDSENRTVEVMSGSSTTIRETLATTYFWNAVGNDKMTFMLSAKWEATGQTAPQVIESSFVPVPFVAGLRQYQYYLYLGFGLCAFGLILFVEPKKRKKT
jgi:hypothetical protein